MVTSMRRSAVVEQSPGGERARGAAPMRIRSSDAMVPPALHFAFVPAQTPSDAPRTDAAVTAREALAGSTGRAHVDAPEVVIHDDPVAQRAAARLGAHGFTWGNRVVIGATAARDAVLRHELRHARQVANYRRGAAPADHRRLEAEADGTGQPRLGADPDDVHGLWWLIPPLLAAGYVLLDPDPANAPGPGDPVYPAKNPLQRAAEGVLFALPAGRLAAGGATMRTMMMWGGGSALGSQAVGDVGRGELSPWNAYAGRGLGGAIGWGLPMGPMNAFTSGARGLPLFTSFMGYGTATGLGLRGSQDLAAGQLSSFEDYLLWGGAGFGAGLLGATVVTGLDFVATMAVSRSNAALSRTVWEVPPPRGVGAPAPSAPSQTIESLDALFARRPDLAGRLGQGYLESRSLAGGGNFCPREGTVNVGGGSETPQFSNLNPFVEGTGGPNGGVYNHVRASFEQIDQVFQPGSVQSIMSNRLPATTVDWPTAAAGAHRVMAPGGTLQINVWSSSAEATDGILTALRNAGFSNVRLGGSLTLSDGTTLAIPSSQTGSGVIVSAVR
jgi:hypothetical protein